MRGTESRSAASDRRSRRLDTPSCSTGSAAGPGDGGAPKLVRGHWRFYKNEAGEVVRRKFVEAFTRRPRTAARGENHSSRPREGLDPRQRNRLPRTNAEQSPARRRGTLDPGQEDDAPPRSEPDNGRERPSAPPQHGLYDPSSQEIPMASQEVFPASPDQLPNCNYGTESSLPSGTV